MSRDTEVASVWDHLDELRTRILRCLAVVGMVGIVAFSFKETLFDIIQGEIFEEGERNYDF